MGEELMKGDLRNSWIKAKFGDGFFPLWSFPTIVQLVGGAVGRTREIGGRRGS
jgi:hypothetical protein